MGIVIGGGTQRSCLEALSSTWRRVGVQVWECLDASHTDVLAAWKEMVKHVEPGTAVYVYVSAPVRSDPEGGFVWCAYPGDGAATEGAGTPDHVRLTDMLRHLPSTCLVGILIDAWQLVKVVVGHVDASVVCAVAVPTGKEVAEDRGCVLAQSLVDVVSSSASSCTVMDLQEVLGTVKGTLHKKQFRLALYDDGSSAEMFMGDVGMRARLSKQAELTGRLERQALLNVCVGAELLGSGVGRASKPWSPTVRAISAIAAALSWPLELRWGPVRAWRCLCFLLVGGLEWAVLPGEDAKAEWLLRARCLELCRGKEDGVKSRHLCLYLSKNYLGEDWSALRAVLHWDEGCVPVTVDAPIGLDSAVEIGRGSSGFVHETVTSSGGGACVKRFYMLDNPGLFGAEKGDATYLRQLDAVRLEAAIMSRLAGCGFVVQVLGLSPDGCMMVSH